MVCDFCHTHDAVIFLEQVNAKGQKRKINMCLQCAQERGISNNPHSIESSIVDLFRELAAVTKRLQWENSRLCPVCGTSIAEIRKTALVGCPECYAIFKDDIRTVMQANGRDGTYTGSMPERLATVHSVLNDRMILQDKLDAAVAEEDYEKAALYRDYLRALENAPVSGEEPPELGEE